MVTALQLGKMTTQEKLRAMEDLWDDLRRTAADIPSPGWHADVLRARERRVRLGQSRFIEWETAKRRVAAKAG